MADSSGAARVSYLIDSLRMGGAERLVVNLARGLVERGVGVQVDIATDRTDDGLASELRSAGIPIANLGVRRLADVPGWRSLLRHYRQQPVDVVHTHLEAANVMGTTVGRVLGLPTVTTQHVFTGDDNRRSLARTRLQHAVLRHSARAVIAVSSAGKAHLVERHGYSPDQITVIHNGVDLATFTPANQETRRLARQRLGISPAATVVVTTSVLRRDKGIQHLLTAMSTVVPRMPDVRLLIVGGGPFEAELKAQASEANLSSHVRFLGQRSDVARILPAADVFAHPTMEDVLPTAVVEAMAAGLPVVASDTGGLPELVVDGLTGVLVAPGDPSALARALACLLADPGRRVAMAAAGRRRAETHFSIEGQLDQLEDVYARVQQSAARTSMNR